MPIFTSQKQLTPDESSVALAHLSACLSHPRCEGVNFPPYMLVPIYVDNVPRLLQSGHWEMNINNLFLPRASTLSGMNDIGWRTALLITLGYALHLDMSSLRPLVLECFTRLIAQHYTSLVKPIMAQTDYDQLAVSADMSQFALWMIDGWYTPNGTQIEVDSTWLILPV